MLACSAGVSRVLRYHIWNHSMGVVQVYVNEITAACSAGFVSFKYIGITACGVVKDNVLKIKYVNFYKLWQHAVQVL